MRTKLGLQVSKVTKCMSVPARGANNCEISRSLVDSPRIELYRVRHEAIDSGNIGLDLASGH